MSDNNWQQVITADAGSIFGLEYAAAGGTITFGAGGFFNATGNFTEGEFISSGIFVQDPGYLSGSLPSTGGFPATKRFFRLVEMQELGPACGLVMRDKFRM